MKRKSQGERILDELRSNPEGLSMRYFERELMISQSTARVSELRSKGYDIRPIATDDFGFTIQRLFGEPEKKRKQEIRVAFGPDGRRYAVMEAGRTLSAHIAADPKFLLGDGGYGRG